MRRLAFIVVALVLAALVLTPAFGQKLTAAQQANLKASLAVDTSVLKSADGQQLLAPSKDNRKVPTRPADPNKLPETDPLHWYDMEWAGWSVKPTNIPKSPGRRRHRQEGHHDRPRRPPLDHRLHPRRQEGGRHVQVELQGPLARTGARTSRTR